MLSPLAIDEIEEMEAAGLHPTPADIVRLNAIGLKLDHSAADDVLYQCRRTATIEDVTLQEPTIGHDLFLADLRHRGFDDNDPVTFVILRAWVLARDQATLPKAYTVPGIRRAIGDFMEAHFKAVTFRRLEMAVNYVLFGYDSAALEYPVRRPEDAQGERTADDEAVDDAWNFALGVVYAGEIHHLGISLADARRHTLAEMKAIVLRATENDYARTPGGLSAFRETTRNKYLGEFYATRDEIRSRLEQSRAAGENPQSHKS